MNRLNLLAALALAAVGLTLAGQPAKAQGPSDPDAPYRMGELTVTAPEVVGRSAIGAPIERVRASRVVYFRDLDLRSRWGMDRLRQRIRNAARSACDELDARYPLAVDTSDDCYSAAVINGMRRAGYITGYQVASY